MIRSVAWLGALSVFACTFALGQAARAAGKDGQLAVGRDLFEKHCELCHGAEGKGDGPLSDELKVAPADLTKISESRGGTFPEVEIREIIDGRRRVRAHGKSEMPIWGRVFSGPAVAGKDAKEVRAKLDALVTYLQSIQAAPPKTVGSAD